MIIIYHTEEKKGIKPAKIFFEKGFDNVFLLTGGLEEFHTQFPDNEWIVGANIPIPKPKGIPESKNQKPRHRRGRRT